MVDRRVAEARRLGERIGGDELAVGSDQERAGVTDVELLDELLPQRLPEHVDDVGRDRDRVGGVAGGGAANRELAAEVVDAQARDGRLDVDPRRIEGRRVELVVERDVERRERWARVETLGAVDLERRVGPPV